MDLSQVRKSQFTLNPVNQVSTGRFSSKSGIPLIKFDISSSDAPMFLKGEDLRINGRIHGETAAGADIASTNLNFVDNFAGRFANCIDTVTIYSKRLNQVIERVTNYSRIVPSIMSALHGEKDLNTKYGSGFSIQPKFSQSAYFRFHNKSEIYNGLYFVGAGTHPGAGVPGVLSSAKVLDKIL